MMVILQNYARVLYKGPPFKVLKDFLAANMTNIPEVREVKVLR